MEYNYFIGMIRQYETARILAYRGQHYRVTNDIPEAFGLLIPEIINILEKNLDKLCKPDENIVVMGLQPAGQMIESSKPITLKRYLGKESSPQHLCCTLDYMVVKSNDSLQTEWGHTESIVIDFTAGALMNDKAYLSQLNVQKIPGEIYGSISSDSLSIAWKAARLRCCEEPSMYAA